MNVPRVMIPVTVLAGLLAVALVVVTPSAASAQVPDTDPIPPVPEVTIPEVPEVTMPTVPETPEVTVPTVPETPELPVVLPGVSTLGDLVDTVIDLLSGLPQVPLLSDLLMSVLETLAGLLGGVGGSEGPGGAPELPVDTSALPLGG